MQFQGRYLFLAERADVWAALNDTAILGEAIPGCELLVWTSGTTLDLAFKVDLGVMHPTFSGDLWLTDIDPAASYVLHGKGRGGLLGLAEGAARISLSDHERGTLMIMQAEGKASSTIMSLGSKLIGSAAQKIIDRFFERFAAAMKADIEVLDPETGQSDTL